MMIQTILTQLRSLKLDGLACALVEQLTFPGMTAMSFEERLALLVDRAIHTRNVRKLVRLLAQTKLKCAQASIEDIDTRPARGIDRGVFSEETT
ncbi:ATP-binding protein [Glaciimonas sp. PAMC28666]|uniref:ATP-binding protein n=1 Tax=Glaciimonas sp. PAMC28666 TaxID=2807626 RepID=UPI00196659A1|nr:ATP-binding protein [Glaciimonas sp. PAMC28666]QRX83421.1 IstB-like ATP-binding domain-containing protein [Glaciimonas sp. PAMC28666]